MQQKISVISYLKMINNKWNNIAQEIEKKKCKSSMALKELAHQETQMQLIELQCSTRFAICVELHWNR